MIRAEQLQRARVCGPIIQVAERATRVKWTDSPLRSRSSIFRSAPRGTSLVAHRLIIADCCCKQAIALTGEFAD